MTFINQIRYETIRTETYSIYADKCGILEPCFCCGKPIKNKDAKYVHFLNNGCIVSTDQPFDDKEDQGFYPVGKTCEKKVPKEFLFKITIKRV